VGVLAISPSVHQLPFCGWVVFGISGRLLNCRQRTAKFSPLQGHLYMAPIRYRRTSLRTALGVTAEEKKLKRELGITEILKPFRWWGNEKRKVKREVGYYSPEAKLARHVFPHSFGKLLLLVLLALGAVPVALGWWLKSTLNQDEPSTTATQSHEFRR
jgi:hypothetical protein